MALDYEAPPVVVQTIIWVLRIALPLLLVLTYRKAQSGTWFLTSKDRHDRSTLLRYRESAGSFPPGWQPLALVSVQDAPHLFARRKKPEKKLEAVAKEKEPSPEDTLHLESLLNYVAFSRKRQEETGEAPEPPKPKKGDQGPDGSFQEKANLDAQMVLQGALSLGSPQQDVAFDVYSTLERNHVKASGRTFELLIEVCIAQADLRAASEFLMKMEAQGHTPTTQLLDTIMELYAQHKMTTELSKKIKGFDDDEKRDQARYGTALSADAPVFVPSGEDLDYSGWGDGEQEDWGWKPGEEFVPSLGAVPEWKPGEEFVPSWAYSQLDAAQADDEKPAGRKGKGGGKDGKQSGKSWGTNGKDAKGGGKGKDSKGKGKAPLVKGLGKGKDDAKGKGKEKGDAKGKAKDKGKGKGKDAKKDGDVLADAIRAAKPKGKGKGDKDDKDKKPPKKESPAKPKTGEASK